MTLIQLQLQHHVRLFVLLISLFYTICRSELVLEKTLLEGTVPCSAGAGSDSITVAPGSSVSVCYTISNPGGGSNDCYGDLLITDATLDATFQEMIAGPLCGDGSPIVIRLLVVAPDSAGEYTSEAQVVGQPVTPEGTLIDDGPGVTMQDSATIQVQEGGGGGGTPDTSAPPTTSTTTAPSTSVPSPTSGPTSSPSDATKNTLEPATSQPSDSPSVAATTEPPVTGAPATAAPDVDTVGPTTGPTTVAITSSPTVGPTSGPTGATITSSPTVGPTTGPTTIAITSSPTAGPTSGPTGATITSSPTVGPTTGPGGGVAMTSSPTSGPTSGPTGATITSSPTVGPATGPGGDVTITSSPTGGPTSSPTGATITSSPMVGPTTAPGEDSTFAPTSGPTSSPTGMMITPSCPAEPPLGETASTLCTSENNVVTLVSIKGVGEYDSTLQDLLASTDILYDLELGADGDEVSFRVQSPLARPGRPTDVYVVHHGPNDSGAWLPAICELNPMVECPFEGSESYVARCDPSPFVDTPGHTLISVYFVTSDLSDEFEADGTGTDDDDDPATVDQCCHADPEGPLASATVVIEVTYMVRCSCPDDLEGEARKRYLR